MIKLYLKQAWQFVKQEKLFSAIYIIGTGLAITMVITISILWYIQLGNIYPENNRDRTMVIRFVGESNKHIDKGPYYTAGFSYETVQEIIYNLTTPQVSTAISNLGNTEEMFIELTDNSMVSAEVKFTDAWFWEVFRFTFLDGKPYTVEEWQSGVPYVVISETLSKRVFGTVESVGKRMMLNFIECRVCGVVRDTSPALPISYADVWIPYTCFPESLASWGETNGVGGMKVYLLLKNRKDAAKAYNEVHEKLHRLNSTFTDRQIEIYGQPELYQKNILRSYGQYEVAWNEIIRNIVLFLFFLLLVPAINLSGMISSRMEKRMSEIGIRKAFGASRIELLNQILWENLLLTCMGGCLGILFSWLVIVGGSSWLISIIDSYQSLDTEGAVEILPEMLINPAIFIVTFFICLLLNILSAILPAWKSLKRNIVTTLYIKK